MKPSLLIRHRLLGIVSVTLILAGAGGLVVGGGSGSQLGLFASACVRSGCVLAALWLAFPRIVEFSVRVPPWLMGALLIGGLSIAIRPRSIAVVGPLLGILSAMQLMGKLLQSTAPTGKRGKRPPKGASPNGADRR